jgi:hypothetical protein
VLGEALYQCDFANHKISHTLFWNFKTSLCVVRSATNRMSQGTTLTYRKDKGQDVNVDATRYMRSGGTASLIFHLGRKWWVNIFTPRPFYPRYTLTKRLGEPATRSDALQKSKTLTLAESWQRSKWKRNVRQILILQYQSGYIDRNFTFSITRIKIQLL